MKKIINPELDNSNNRNNPLYSTSFFNKTIYLNALLILLSII